jgi:hypothetical protein
VLSSVHCWHFSSSLLFTVANFIYSILKVETSLVLISLAGVMHSPFELLIFGHDMMVAGTESDAPLSQIFS